VLGAPTSSGFESLVAEGLRSGDNRSGHRKAKIFGFDLLERYAVLRDVFIPGLPDQGHIARVGGLKPP
jgi:hypothetical protein